MFQTVALVLDREINLSSTRQKFERIEKYELSSSGENAATSYEMWNGMSSNRWVKNWCGVSFDPIGPPISELVCIHYDVSEG